MAQDMEHAVTMEEDVIMHQDQEMAIVDADNKIVRVGGRRYQHVQAYLLNLNHVRFHNGSWWFVGDLEDGQHEIFFNPDDIPTDSSFVAL